MLTAAKMPCQMVDAAVGLLADIADEGITASVSLAAGISGSLVHGHVDQGAFVPECGDARWSAFCLPDAARQRWRRYQMSTASDATSGCCQDSSIRIARVSSVGIAENDARQRARSISALWNTSDFGRGCGYLGSRYQKRPCCLQPTTIHIACEQRDRVVK